MASYLSEILYDRFLFKASHIIPELPIRVGTVWDSHDNTNHADRSYKVDYYAKLENGLNIFIEFKTDSGSRRDKQDAYLSKSSQIGMTKILNGIIQISKVSPYKTKYNFLLSQLSEAGLLNIDGDEHTLNILNDEILIIYIQPKLTLTSEIKPSNEIDFNRIAKVIDENHKDELSIRLSQRLRNWASH